MTPLEKLTELRATYPDLLSSDEIGALLNRLAWLYRDEGMRLLGKEGGNNVPQPLTGKPISSDYLVHLPTLTGWDVFTDNSRDGLPATRNAIIVGFEWGPGPEPLGGKIASGARSLVEAVDPGIDDTNNGGGEDPGDVVLADDVMQAFQDLETNIVNLRNEVKNNTAQVVALHTRVQWAVDAANEVSRKLDRPYRGSIRYLGSFTLTPQEKE